MREEGCSRTSCYRRPLTAYDMRSMLTLHNMQEDIMRQDAQIAKMAEQGYIPASEAAEALGVSVFTLYRWAGTNKVTGVKVGIHWFFERKSLLDYVGPQAAKLLGLDKQASTAKGG